MDTPHQPAQLCPLLDEPCRTHACTWYIRLQGMNPQTGAVMDQGGCAVGFLPLLLVENSNLQRHTAAEVSALRGELERQNKEAKTAMGQLLARRLASATGFQS